MDIASLHEALIYMMVIMSAADRDMTDAELARIGLVVGSLPVFKGFDQRQLIPVARKCQEYLQDDDGLETILDIISDGVPEKLYDTAYAIAVEVAAADLDVQQEELRVLQILRERFGTDPLMVAVIERAASIRHRRPG